MTKFTMGWKPQPPLPKAGSLWKLSSTALDVVFWINPGIECAINGKDYFYVTGHDTFFMYLGKEARFGPAKLYYCQFLVNERVVWLSAYECERLESAKPKS